MQSFHNCGEPVRKIDSSSPPAYVMFLLSSPSLCRFLSIIPSLCSDEAADEKLMADAVSKLWTLISTSKNDKVVVAALNALAKFNLEQLSLKLLPDVYRCKVRLPKEYIKTPVDVNSKPEDVLQYIPGN